MVDADVLKQTDNYFEAQISAACSTAVTKTPEAEKHESSLVVTSDGTKRNPHCTFSSSSCTWDSVTQAWPPEGNRAYVGKFPNPKRD